MSNTEPGRLQAFYDDLLSDDYIDRWCEANRSLIVRAYVTGDWTLLDQAVAPPLERPYDGWEFESHFGGFIQ